MSYFWTLSGAAGLLLALLLIGVLLRGSFRKFPLLLMYMVAQVLTTVAESTVYFQGYGWTDFGKRIYWVDEMILQVLVFGLVFSLMSKALANSPKPAKVRASLVLGALVVMALCMLLAYDSAGTFSHWMTDASRNLSFASAILNMALWSIILSQHDRDPQFMLICGGLGIQTTGRAIGHSLRRLQVIEIGNLLIVITYLLSIVIILWALRKNWSEPAARAVR